MKNHSIFFVFTFIIVFSCSTPEVEESEASFEPIQHANSESGMVSTAHPLATQVAADILDQGGNAVDAAIAAAFTLAVVEPSMSGLGGRLQAIVRDAEGNLHGVDATTQAPMSYEEDTTKRYTYGYEVIGIPGVVKGLSKLHNDHGTLPWSDLMESAIRFANEGFEILQGEALRHSMAKEQIMEFEATSSSFIKQGDTITYQAGDTWIQKDLGNTLSQIAENGAEVFYTGEIAEKIAADMQMNGAPLTLESLAAYEAKTSTIVSGSYRGVDVHGLWMPAFGAITIEILQILENFELSNISDGEYASIMFQAISLAYEDRYKQTSVEDAQWLTSKEYAMSQAEKIFTGSLEEIGENSIPESQEPLAWNNDPGHTTHLSIIDGSGMMIALTQSLGPNMGSKVITPGLGFVYASTLGGYLGRFQPGQRAASHISPMILTKDGRPFMAIGAAGGSRINTAIVQAISQVIDRDNNLYEALGAKRIHPADEGMFIESHEGLTWSQEDLDFLETNGFLGETIDAEGRFGRVHAVRFLESLGEYEGAADPDWEGAVKGPAGKK